MPKAISHPDYAYEPMRESTRAKLREAHRKRLGNLPGHYRVYGVQVPEDKKPEVSRYACRIATLRGREAAEIATLQMKANNWVVPDDLPRRWYGERPAGHILVQGVWVPKAVWLKIVRYILQMFWLKKYGREAVRTWLLKAKAANWSVELKPLEKSTAEARNWEKWWPLMESLLEEGMTLDEVASYLGVNLATFQANVRTAQKLGLTQFRSKRKGHLEWL
jgi:hypothetical protein